VVANASGASIQNTHYYPFGTAYSESTGQEKQPYKYNGKELDLRHGLNLYDYSARYMESTTGRFTSVDPLAEKYYSISPYVYVGNNPIKLVDINGKEWGVVVNANGTMTVTLNVGFTVSSNLNLSTAQIDSYKAAISAQFNNTFMESSGGRISAVINFDGGNDPNRFTPNILLVGGSDSMAAGMYVMGQESVPLMVDNANNMAEFGETGVHELFHTLNLDDVTASPYIADTRMIKANRQYYTLMPSINNIHKNIMNYGRTKINGKSYLEIYKSYSGMNHLTSGQLNFIIRSIQKQMQGYGQRPTKKASETDKEYEKRCKEYYDDYWNHPEDM